ncbi:hypothetical protein VB005_04635 [Metarhizium brunneum]
MAAPPETNIRNLTGVWRMSKTLSDDMGPSLAIQGIPWIVRKAISWATITGNLTQATDNAGNTTITVAQTASGGIKGETEIYNLDEREYKASSTMFGVQRIRAGWVDLRVEKPLSLSGRPFDTYLSEGWIEEDDPKVAGHITAYIVSEQAGWSVEQVWGFSIIDEKRYRVIRFIVRKGEESAASRVVYEWLGGDSTS